MRILLFLLFPIFLSAQITRSYGVIEISGFPISSTTGPKFAYNPADSSFYRWRSGSTWIKVIEPSIISAGWGIIKTGLTYLVDSSKVASRYYVSTSPTTIAANYIATSNGTNLVARNLFDNGTAVSILNSKPLQLGQWTPAGRPAGTAGYMGWNTTLTGLEWYNGTRWAYALESTFARGTATRVPFFDANGQITESANITYINAQNQLLITGTNSSALNGYAALKLTPNITIANGTTNTASFLDLSGTITVNTANQIPKALSMAVDYGGATSLNQIYGLDIVASNAPTLQSNRIYNSTANANAGAELRILDLAGGGFNFRTIRGGTAGSYVPGINFSNGTNSYGMTSTSSMPFQLIVSAAGNPNAGSFAMGVNTSQNVIFQTTGGALITPLAKVHVQGTSTTTGSAFLVSNSLPTTILDVKNTGRVNIGNPTDNASAILNIGSTTQGILPPRWTAAQLAAILSPATGLFGYQTDGAEGVYFKAAAGFKRLLWEGDATWLKTELEANRDINVVGAASTDLRIQNTRIQFDGKFKVGSDSSFVHNPSTDTTFIKGSARIRDGDLRIENTTTSPYLIIEAKGSGNKEANIYLKSSGLFSPIIEIDAQAGSAGSAKALGFYNHNTANGGDNTFRIGSELGQFGGRSIGRFAVYDSLELNRRFAFNSNGIAVFSDYGTSATTAATLGKTESGYIASFATDGTVLSRTLSSIQDGNGLVSALPAGNVAINAATNNLEINNLGTLTLETSGSALIYADSFETDIYSPEYAEIVAGTGAKITLDNATELVGITGTVEMEQYSLGNKKSTDLGISDTKFIPKFGNGGVITDYYLARDTFIEDVTLFSVGALMQTCQELTIVSSMTNLAPTNMEIRFPDASDVLRGKKIIVNSIRKDAGLYIPQIRIVGGVSRLFYTTNTLTTAPTSQSGLDLDGSTWPQFASYEFTCLKINSTDYRWVLKQR